MALFSEPRLTKDNNKFVNPVQYDEVIVILDVFQCARDRLVEFEYRQECLPLRVQYCVLGLISMGKLIIASPKGEAISECAQG